MSKNLKEKIRFPWMYKYNHWQGTLFAFKSITV